MQVPTHPILRAVAWLSASIAVAGCSSADSRAQAALGEYQAAAASNDMLGARRALLKLVQAKDDVSEYWAELGKLEASMGEYGDAYYAFTRAYELDRSNPDLVRALTQLALRSGDLATAQARAEELEVLVPGDPWVKLTKGWADVGESRFDEGLTIADEVLAQTPLDPAATVLKSRALVGLNRDDEAIAFLKGHLQSVTTDSGALTLLAQIYERRSDWANVAAIRQRLAQVNPNDQDNLTALVNASLRSNNIPLARAASARLLQPQTPPGLVSTVMNVWSAEWPSPRRIVDAQKFAAAAPLQQRLVYAAFLSRWGQPADAIRLIADSASLPVNAGNAEANAVVGDALSRLGKVADAKSRLDAVIGYDPGNATALRARTELELRLKKPADAVQDAQKLATVVPNSAPDRLLLSQAFAAAGDKTSADRALWQAFHDIPANDSLYAALRSTRSGNPDALADLQAEFDRQRDAQVRKGLL
jgi:predicted Zn-dependent protease